MDIDITERKKAETALLESEKQFHALAPRGDTPNCLDHKGGWLEHLFQPSIGGVYRPYTGGKLWPWLEQALSPR
ncbi:MAG: hypothetical protein ACLPN1_18280 [Dissulfurispiraceae bacterium]